MTVCLSRYYIASSHGLRTGFSNTHTVIVSVQESQESTLQKNVTTTVLYMRTV